MFVRKQQSEPRPFSLVELEAEIATEMSRLPLPTLREVQPEDFAPPNHRLPDYAEHREGVDQVGKLTAEAVIQQYESAAKEVEAMGTELTERLKKLDATKTEAMAALDEVKEVAQKYRDEGKRVFLQIEDCSIMTQEVRTACNTLRAKIALPT